MITSANIFALIDVQVEVNDLINKIDNGTSHLNFTEFCKILLEKSSETDLETEYKVGRER